MDDFPTPINVTYDVARTAFKAEQYIKEISKHELFAADFEVAIRYSKKQIEEWKCLLQQETLTKLERVAIQSKLDATALDHPSHCTITHCTISVSDNHSYVFILDNRSITNYVLYFLVTTPIKQVWHNATYDFSKIYYYTGKFPINYEDTQILAKTLINHVNTFKAKTGLKELAGYKYGDWGISADNFTKEQMYDEKVLKYAATDSAATYWLWSYLQKECDDIDNTITRGVTKNE